MKAETTFLSIRYATLLEVVISHEYYDQGYCPYITLEPSPACYRLLQSYRLQFLKSPQGGKLLGQTPALIDLPTEPLVLEFYLRQLSEEFLAVTALGDGSSASAGAYQFTYNAGAWAHARGIPASPPQRQGVALVLQVGATLRPSAPETVQLSLETPIVSWRYYLVTAAQYVADGLQIAENNTVVSTAITPPAAEAASIARRFADKQVTALGVTMKLKKDFPAWYLVTTGSGSPTHVADVPPLPKPRPGALPHLILDYSSILK